MVMNLKDEIALELEGKRRAQELAREKIEHDRQVRLARLPNRTSIEETDDGAILSIAAGPVFNRVSLLFFGLILMVVAMIGISLFVQDRFPWILAPIFSFLLLLPFLFRARPLKVHVTGSYYAVYRHNPKHRLETGLHRDLSFYWAKWSHTDAMAIRGKGRRFSVPYFSDQDAAVVNEFCKKHMGHEHDQLGI